MFFYARDSRNIINKKRNKVPVKGLDNASKKYLDTVNYIKDNLKDVWKNEYISVEEIFYFVVLLF